MRDVSVTYRTGQGEVPAVREVDAVAEGTVDHIAGRLGFGASLTRLA